MKTRIMLTALISGAAFVLGACASKDDPNYLWLMAAGSGSTTGAPAVSEEAQPFEIDVTDVTGEEEFLFNSTRTIPVFITVSDHIAPVDGSLVQILEIAGAGADTGKVIFQAASDGAGNVSGSFTINSSTNIVTLKFTYQGVTQTFDIDVTNVLEINRTIYVMADLAPVVVVDSDGDGVPDEADAFPNDPALAATVRIPGESYYTVAYEDLYPKAGDADFNDYVLRVYNEEDLNAAGKVVRVRGVYTHIAKGAGYNHTLHLTLPGAPTGVYTLKRFAADGQLESESAPTATAIAGIELLPSSNTTISQSNTAQGQSLVPGKRAEIEITLDTPQARTATGAAPYDLYIHVKNTGHDIHFLGRYFDGEGQDLYLDSNGFPWALLVPGDWNWPYEKKNIHEGYEFFDDWYTSLGTAFTDWYETFAEDFVFPVTAD